MNDRCRFRERLRLRSSCDKRLRVLCGGCHEIEHRRIDRRRSLQQGDAVLRRTAADKPDIKLEIGEEILIEYASLLRERDDVVHPLLRLHALLHCTLKIPSHSLPHNLLHSPLCVLRVLYSTIRPLSPVPRKGFRTSAEFARESVRRERIGVYRKPQEATLRSVLAGDRVFVHVHACGISRRGNGL